MEKDITKRMSKSKYNTFITCPKQYWYSQYFPEQAEKSPAMERGIELHDIFDDYFKLPESKTAKNKESMKELIFQLRNSSKYPLEIEKFIEWSSELNFITPESCEEKIYDKDLDIVIKWDRIDYDGEKRILWDYKTGNLKKVEDFKFELALYSLIFQKNTKKKVHYAGIYFVDHKKYGIIEITSELMKETIDKIQDLNSELRDYQNSNVWPTKLGYHCSWCRWKSECPTYNKYKK